MNTKENFNKLLSDLDGLKEIKYKGHTLDVNYICNKITTLINRSDVKCKEQ